MAFRRHKIRFHTISLVSLSFQNDILSLTLSESKCACEDLTVAIGRYESNHTAHQLAAQCTDQLVSIILF